MATYTYIVTNNDRSGAMWNTDENFHQVYSNGRGVNMDAFNLLREIDEPMAGFEMKCDIKIYEMNTDTNKLENVSEIYADHWLWSGEFDHEEDLPAFVQMNSDEIRHLFGEREI